MGVKKTSFEGAGCQGTNGLSVLMIFVSNQVQPSDRRTGSTLVHRPEDGHHEGVPGRDGRLHGRGRKRFGLADHLPDPETDRSQLAEIRLSPGSGWQQ